MYYVLENDMSIVLVGTVIEEDSAGLAGKYTQGLKLTPEEQPRNLRVEVELGPDSYPDYFVLQATPIVSRAFLDALSLAGIENYEAYPALIHDAGKMIEGYFVWNLVGRIACLNADASRLTKMRERIFRILELAIDEAKIGSADLFRLQEYGLIILVSERVHKALKGLHGVVMGPAQGWTSYHRY